MTEIALLTRRAAAAAPSTPWDAEAYITALHPSGSTGRVTLMAREHGGLRSRTWSVEDARSPVVLGAYAEAHGYVAMNRYFGPRGGGRRLAALNAMWLDLDVHRVERLKRRSREQLVADLLRDVAARELPTPSFVVDSGRGLYAIWLIEPVPARAEPRWRAAMRAIVGLFRDWGADPACVDPARVLRLVGSRNEKSDREVRVLAGGGDRIPFDHLADSAFTATGGPDRRTLEAKRSGRASRRERGAEDEARSPRRPPVAERWRGVLRDLDRLRRHHGGTIPVGWRDLWLHLRAAALAHLVDPARVAAETLASAASAAPSLSARKVDRWIRPVVQRAENAAAGRRNARGGDPRYAYAGATMAPLLGVDVSLARRLGLEQVIPKALREERRRDRRRDRRRTAGVLPRSLWLALHPLSRERPWEAEGVSRATWYRRRRIRIEARLRDARRASCGGRDAARAG
jgi:hypothetical protein